MKSKIIKTIILVLVLSSLTFISNSYAEDKNVERISGNDRYSTSISISRVSFEKSDNAIIANGKIFADALSGGQLSSALNSPILLTDGNINDNLINELQRLGVKKVYLLGGYKSIPAKLENSLKKLYSIERIAGKDRFETSEKIALLSRDFGKSKDTIIVNGNNFADALSGGAIVANTNKTMVLTNGKNLPNINIGQPLILGGKNSVSMNIKGERIAGKDRYETALNAMKKYFKEPKNVILVSGESYPDALTSVSLSKLKNSPIILTKRYNIINTAKDYLNNSSNLFIVGGESTISDLIIYKLQPNTIITKIEYKNGEVVESKKNIDIKNIDKEKNSIFDGYVTVYFDESEAEDYDSSRGVSSSIYKKGSKINTYFHFGIGEYYRYWEENGKKFDTNKPLMKDHLLIKKSIKVTDNFINSFKSENGEIVTFLVFENSNFKKNFVKIGDSISRMQLEDTARGYGFSIKSVELNGKTYEFEYFVDKFSNLIDKNKKNIAKLNLEKHKDSSVIDEKPRPKNEFKITVRDELRGDYVDYTKDGKFYFYGNGNDKYFLKGYEIDGKFIYKINRESHSLSFNKDTTVKLVYVKRDPSLVNIVFYNDIDHTPNFEYDTYDNNLYFKEGTILNLDELTKSIKDKIEKNNREFSTYTIVEKNGNNNFIKKFSSNKLEVKKEYFDKAKDHKVIKIAVFSKPKTKNIKIIFNDSYLNKKEEFDYEYNISENNIPKIIDDKILNLIEYNHNYNDKSKYFEEINIKKVNPNGKTFYEKYVDPNNEVHCDIKWLDKIDGWLVDKKDNAIVGIYNNFDSNILTIPSNINGIKIDKIRPLSRKTTDWHPGNCNVLKISEGIKYILDGSFSYAHFNGTLVLPDSLEYIGNSSFSDNYFSKIMFAKGNLTIGNAAFRDNSLSGELTIPKNIIKIYDGAFIDNKITVIKYYDDSNYSYYWNLKSYSDKKFYNTEKIK